MRRLDARRVAHTMALATAACVPGCQPQSAGGPPVVVLGDSVCHQCNMIISDERWATATVIEGPRGPEAMLFDDFNCQVNYEVGHAGAQVVARWSHDFAGAGWIRTADAHFLMSPNLRSPMGSKVAAFASRSNAEAARADLTGDLMTFEIAWTRLGMTGGACHDTQDPDPSAQGAQHAP